MRIDNRTQYDTRAIRRLLFEVHRRVAGNRGRLAQWKRSTCQVTYRRGGGIAGYAYVRGTRMRLLLPNPKRGSADSRKVAGVLHHELLHLYGFHERDFGSALKRGIYRDPEPWQWAADLVGLALPWKSAAVRPRRDLVTERGAKAEAHLVAWERRLKTAQRKVKEYRKVARYYRRRLVERQAGGPVGEDPAPGQRSLLAAPEQTQARPGIWAGSPGLAALLEGRPGATDGLDVAPGEPTAGTGSGTEESA